MEQCKNGRQEVKSGKRISDYMDVKSRLAWLKSFFPREQIDELKNLWKSKSFTLPAWNEIQQPPSDDETKSWHGRLKDLIWH